MTAAEAAHIDEIALPEGGRLRSPNGGDASTASRVPTAGCGKGGKLADTFEEDQSAPLEIGENSSVGTRRSFTLMPPRGPPSVAWRGVEHGEPRSHGVRLRHDGGVEVAATGFTTSVRTSPYRRASSV